MEVRTLLPNVRRLYGEQANPLTDEDLILQFADIYEGDPIEDISDVVSLMENNAIREINSVSENSQLKNFRRLYGDQVAGTSDEDILYDYIQSENIDPETSLTDIVSDLEESASRGLYKEDVESFGNSVAQNDQIRQSISAIKEVAGDGSTLFQSENPYDDSDIDNVISFLKKEEDRGFIDKLKDDFVDKITPFKGLTDLFKSAGQAISAFTQDNTGRSLEFAKLENAVSDPRVINRFVREAQRYVENPNLFSEEEKQNLISAAKIFETTSFNIDTSNPESIENFSSSAAKSILIQPISSLVTVAESGLENLGLDESFINDISRNLSFIDANVAESDGSTISGLAGGVAGSAVQSALLILSGAGPVAMAGVFGTQGAADNIETYRSFVESNGGDPNKAVENIVALGGAVISGTLGTLTGRGIESLPGVNKVIQGGQQALYKSALSEAFTSPASKENLFRIGKETLQTVFKDRKNASNAAKSYLRFAASTAPVEGFEEVSEEALNELLLNVTVEDFQYDPEEFKRRLLISGIGGTIAGASFGPIQRMKMREDAKTLTDNFLGLDLIGPSNQEEAQVELDRLIQKENLYQSRFEGGQFPPAIEALISDHKNRLTGIINEDITPGEAYPDIQSSNSELSFGDVLLDPRLRDTPLYNAVEKDLTKKGTSKINDNQNEAYDAIIDYLDNSDLSETLTTDFIKSKVYKTPISKVEGRRKGVTFTDTIHSIAGRKEKTFSGTYLTNDSDLDAAYDEVFHMINDSRSDQDLQNLVNSYNQVYGTNHNVDSYSTNQEVRDEIAKKATEILLKKESLPEVDGEFKRTVEAFQNGNILEVNPDIGNIFELGNRVPITGQQLSDGMVNGDFRRVNDGSGRALFQDNKNDVYVLSETDGKQYITKIADGEFTEELPTLDARVVVSKTKLEEINNDFRIKRKVEPLRLTLIENDEAFDENWFVPNNLQLTQPFTRIEEGFNINQTGNNRFDNRTSNQLEQGLNIDQPIEPVVVTSPLQVTEGDLVERTFRKFVNGPNNKILELDDENNVIGAFIRNQVGEINSLESTEATKLDKAYVNKFINVNDKGQRLLGDGKPVETSNEDLVNQLLQTLAEQGKDPISLLLQKRLKELKQQNRTPASEELKTFLDGDYPLANLEHFIRTIKKINGDQIRVNAALLRDFLEGNYPQAQIEEFIRRAESSGLFETEVEDAEIIDDVTDVAEDQDIIEQSTADEVEEIIEPEPEPKILIDEATLEEVFKPDFLNKLTDEEKVVVSKMLDETSEPGVFKLKSGVHADSGLPLYQLDGKIAKSLKKKKIVVKGKALLGDVVTETLDDIVAFNPKSFKGEESDIPKESVETFIDFVRPKKSSKTFKTTEVRDDEDVVKIYSSPTSARNSIESQFEMEGDLEDGTFSIGGREFVFTNKTVVTDELLKDYYSQPMGDTTLGEVIQTYLDNVGNGSDRVALGKAVRKLSGRVIKSAKGQNVSVDQALEEVLDIVLGSEEEVITEIDYNSPEAKDTFRKLRQAVKRGRLSLEGTQMVFKTKKSSSRDKMVETINLFDGIINQNEKVGNDYIIKSSMTEQFLSEVFGEDFNTEEFNRLPFLEGEVTLSNSVPNEVATLLTSLYKEIDIKGNLRIMTYEDVFAELDSGLDLHMKYRTALEKIKKEYDNEEGSVHGQLQGLKPGENLDFIVVVNTNRDLNDILQSSIHEFGHVIEFDSRYNHKNESSKVLKNRHSEILEEYKDKLLTNYISDNYSDGRGKFVLDILLNRAPNEFQNLTLDQSLNSNNAEFRGIAEYLTDLDEWTAEQFVKYNVDRKENSPVIKKYFDEVIEKVKKAFKKAFNLKTKEVDEVYKSWLDSRITREVGISEVNSIENDINSEFASQEMLDNEFEGALSSYIFANRGTVSNWREIEDAIKAGRNVESFKGREKIYAASFKQAFDMRNRTLPDDAPLDVIASYSTANPTFPMVLEDRIRKLYDGFRNSILNDLRRRLFSPIITRAQIVADRHPEIQALKDLVTSTISVPGEFSNTLSYTDKVEAEKTRRTNDISRTLDPIFKSFGYDGSIVRKGGALLNEAIKKKRGKHNITNVLEWVALGVRNKDFVKEHLNNEYDGKTLNEIIDDVRAQMDSLRDYAEEKGVLREQDFITYKDGGVQHYLPRIYNKELIQNNYEFFRKNIVEKNLREVYRKARYAEEFDEMTEEEFEALEVPSDFKLNESDEKAIAKVANDITSKIAYGRETSMEFNEQFNGFTSFADVVEMVATTAPARLKKRKLWFIPDEELFGVTEVEGRKINFMESNILNIMGSSIYQIVRHAEFKDSYGEEGNLFAQAYEALNEKEKNETDAKERELIKRDKHHIKRLFDSISERVGLAEPGTKRFVDQPSVSAAIKGFSTLGTVSVMGLSSILAVVETGTIPVRVGLVPGLKAMMTGISVAFKKTANRLTNLGDDTRFTDSMERELMSLGYMNEAGDDFLSRTRFDPMAEQNGEINVDKASDTTFNWIQDAFYRVTLLEQITRISQITAAHAANNMISSMIDVSRNGQPLNGRQIRELQRLGFVDNKGNFDRAAFDAYADFFTRLQEMKKRGNDQELQNFVESNSDMYRLDHHRVLTRLINQMITKPNVATRTAWGNSKNPLIRSMYRLRSFTHGYRAFHGAFFTNEIRDLYNDKDHYGLILFLSRFLPLIALASMAVVGRAEIKASLAEMSGNDTKAKRIRTNLENMDAADFMFEAIDKSGVTMQLAELPGAYESMKYGNSVFATMGGVVASKTERLANGAMRTGTTGDPAYLMNEVLDLTPGANTGAFDALYIKPQTTRKQTKNDQDFYGSLNSGNASWWND